MTKPHIATLAIHIVLTASCKEKPTLLGLSTSLGHSLYQLGSLPLRFSKVYKRARIGSGLLEVRIGISCVQLIGQVTWPSTMCRCLQFANFLLAHHIIKRDHRQRPCYIHHNDYLEYGLPPEPSPNSPSASKTYSASFINLQETWLQPSHYKT